MNIRHHNAIKVSCLNIDDAIYPATSVVYVYQVELDKLELHQPVCVPHPVFGGTGSPICVDA